MVDALRLLRKVCPCLHQCEIVVMGIEPRVIELNAGLSREVAQSFAEMVRLVLGEIRSKGCDYIM